MNIKTANLNLENSIDLPKEYLTLPIIDTPYNATNFNDLNSKHRYSLCSINNKSTKVEKNHTWLSNKLKKENLEDFIPQESYKGYYTEITFLHKKCNKTFKETPQNFFRRKNKCPHCNKDKFILNCSKDYITSNNLDNEKHKIIQEKMDLIYNGEFKFIRVNPKDKYSVELEHSKCKKKFMDYRRKIYTDKIRCPYCSEDIKRNSFISTNDKIELYEKKLQGRFKILDEFTGQRDKVRLQRVSCGHIIKKSLNEVLRKNYVDSCPECKRLERLNSLIEKLDKKYNGRIKVLNGVEKYQNNQSNLLFFDNVHNTKFKSSFTKLLNTKLKEYPSCRNEKHFVSKLKNKDKVKFYEEKLQEKFKILDKFSNPKDKIRLQRISCGHTIKKSLNEVLNKNYIDSCPECNRLEELDSLTKKLEKKYNGRIKVLNGAEKYKNNQSNLLFFDNVYKIEFTSSFAQFLNTQIDSEDILEFYNTLLEKRFKILDDIINGEDKIRLQRVSCGHIINRSLNDVLRKNYTDSCPECTRLKRLNSLVEKLDEKYNGRIRVLNGIEKYKNSQSNLLFFDNECKNKFTSSFKRLLNKESNDCPICGNGKDPLSKLKSEVYHKYKGEYIVIGDYVDSKTPILFKHTKCKHVFFKRKDNFFNSKVPCKECGKKTNSLDIKRAQEKVNKKFGKLFTLKGIYKNLKTEMPIVCNNCHTIEEVSVNKLLDRTRCIHCKTAFK